MYVCLSADVDTDDMLWRFSASNRAKFFLMGLINFRTSFASRQPWHVQDLNSYPRFHPRTVDQPPVDKPSIPLGKKIL
ncbi:hypothetical protein NPIL_431631 [Nephila pilipes]|uniref:Uncharacterized protein n=1 Tax=Nephila pilipes TaxID=299642 RepID=A0A8X6NC37_NEPPI|nr:hypothetical protein NPIL_431631 [Nephila pilipes]